MMPERKREEPTPRYIVANPHGVPEKVPIITIDGEDGQSRHYYEGDVYDGPRAASFHEEGYLLTPKQAERAEKEQESEEAPSWGS